MVNDRSKRLHAELIKKREELIETLTKERQSVEVSSHGDLVDRDSNYSERELMMGMTEHDMSMLKGIDAALQKIEEKTYGTCEECSEDIPEARLIAVPTTTLCLECQSKRERSGSW